MGKLLADSLVDVNDAAHTFDYYAGLAVEQHGQTLEVPGESMSMVVREPIGVTAGITPWNFPILMAAWKVAPCARRRQRHDPEAGLGLAADLDRARPDRR